MSLRLRLRCLAACLAVFITRPFGKIEPMVHLFSDRTRRKGCRRILTGVWSHSGGKADPTCGAGTTFGWPESGLSAGVLLLVGGVNGSESLDEMEVQVKTTTST
ncbi:hypothetical protein ACGFWF_38960 [Streptomyces sp. NPDC048581]|uniref:hypothetical protein n=1 Tax=Streptomyces sp. NPDC048581 TaxID=3365572 RepID=UPI00371581C7